MPSAFGLQSIHLILLFLFYDPILSDAYGLCICLSVFAGIIFCLAKGECMGCTGCDAGRLQAGFEPVSAIIAFHDLACGLIPLRNLPGAYHHTGLATHTAFFVHINDPVFRAFDHGPGWADRHTPWLLAMETRQKGRYDLRLFRCLPWTISQQHAQPNFRREMIVNLTLDLASLAADAPF